jgi:uncharacterized protein (TIGR03118 family)
MKMLSRFLFAAVLVALACSIFAGPAGAVGYYRLDLVSDIPGLAKFTDPDLVNPWGLAVAPNGNFWVADNGTGVATVYKPSGEKVPLTVTIPPPMGAIGPSTPTGEVFDPCNDFILNNGVASAPAIFIWDTEDGTISGWSLATQFSDSSPLLASPTTAISLWRSSSDRMPSLKMA